MRGITRADATWPAMQGVDQANLQRGDSAMLSLLPVLLLVGSYQEE